MLFLLRWLSRRSAAVSARPAAPSLGWLAYALSPSYRRRLAPTRALAGVGAAAAAPAVGEAGKMVLELLRLWLRPAR